ncbi:Apoptosis-inducing factor 1 [Venturia nashicola]|uniref:Apoptosis-inducing factor 1 n=1 Tax=Venturia nashicola TaxID=86259 RepID=A0A4Z1PUD8_9PEZI|nr:Apoptosis-inducing factor 1 [Venturia nashicola]
MFADHRSSLSTPSATPPPLSRSPSSRRGPYSASGPGPLPPRPGLNPRSSSLSLASTPNASTTNLPTLRVTTGSSLRNEMRRSPPMEVPDPMRVLQSIFGAPPRKQMAGNEDGRPVELAEEVDFGGLSLEEFADKKEERGSTQSIDVHNYTVQSIEQYSNEKEKFEDLHKSITACDEVLKSVESYLTGFQTDLGAVSAEIETLQSRSTAMNTKLENRRVVEKLLGPSVEDLSLSPAVVRTISEGPIDESWAKALGDLEKRKKLIESRQQDRQKLKALDDLKPLLENLNNRAIERIRDHFVSQIKALRSPNINAQVIQQDAFLKYKELFTFLAHHQRKLAEEIGRAYINTMRWYYLNHFTRYETALKSIKLHVLDKNDVIGQQDDPQIRRNLKGPASHDAFSIGRRTDAIKTSSSSALSSYLAEEDKQTHYLELPFRSFNLALIDNASFEYSFLSSFFAPTQNFHAISRTFEAIFAPTFSHGQTLTKSLVENSVDALGILLCVRLNQHFAFELQRRKVPAMDGYTNATNMLLWPRFQMVIDLHCESLRRATAALSGRPATGSTLLTGGSSNAQSTAPHQLTQRFASFLHGILSLSSEAGDDEPVANSLGRMRGDYEAFMTKLSKGVGDQRKRERFLFNNYSLVGTILEGAQGRLADDNRLHFEKLKEAYGDGR